MRKALIIGMTLGSVWGIYYFATEDTAPIPKPTHDVPTTIAGAQITALLTTNSHLISGDAGGRIRMWSRGNDEVEYSWFGHDGPIRALMKHGDNFASVGADGRVVVWHKDQAMRRFRLKDYRLNDACFDGDAVFLAAERGTIARRGSKPHWIRKSVHGQGTFAITLSPDRGRLASAGTDGRVRIWSPEDGSPMKQWRVSDTWVTQLVWVTNGLITADGHGVVQRWHIEPGHTQRSVKTITRLNSPIVAMAVNEHQLLVSTADKHVRLLDVRNGVELFDDRCKSRPAMALTIDEKAFMYGDGNGNIVRRDVTSGRSIGTLPAVSQRSTSWEDLPKN